MPARRQLLGASLAAGVGAVLAGCGFTLRGNQNYAFRSLYTGSAATSLGLELRRNVTSGGQVTWIVDAARRAEADVVLDILSEQREKVVVGVNSSGQVREFQLRVRVRFRLTTPPGKVLIEESEILQQRDISFNESAVLGKEAEEAVLYREMQSDVVQQLMRRLASVRSL